MRVAIEAAPLTLSSGGLARYTAGVGIALASAYPADDFVYVSDQPFELPHGSPPNLIRGGGPRNPVERRWWLWGLNREIHRQRANLVHGPDFSVPYIPQYPSVMTLHDLSPWMDPSWHADADRVRRRTPVLLALGIATMVLTVSETVRRQAMERFRIPAERIVAVPLAAALEFRRVEAPPPPTPYFLHVGTIEPRKNLPALIEAWRAVRREREVDLVIVGRRRGDAPEIAAEPGLRLAGEVADADLPALYSGATALVCPSHYEGFGLPVLEAMQCGACVVASTALRETAGEAALYAADDMELAQTMTALLDHPELLAERRERSLARARDFSWERTAQGTYAAYQEARRRFGR
jgi:glycosyltransferase involved in cell wall biosynthesis